ncbi:MAG: LssY C-terminal domain-containing protein [Candidatus Binatia bacterium]
MLRPTTSLRAFRPVLLTVSLLTAGCSASFNPKPIESVPFRDRAITQERSNVRVTAAVPSREETRELFDARLYRRNIQPIWLEIHNGRDEDIFFLPFGLDPEYYTPLETAYIHLGGQWDRDVGRYFYERGLDLPVSAGETVSGYLFTPLDEGTKAFNVDIISEDANIGFAFFVPVPGLRVDHQTVDWEAIYPGEEANLPANELIEVLEGFACCTRDKKEKGTGDPLNLVVIGDLEDVYFAFVRAGWDETETINRGSLWKTMGSFFSGGEYRYSPVSGLYAFGRPQDVAFQKARDNIHERNHLRLWLAPIRFEGKPVWMGQISRDIGVRFTSKTITTHKVDPDVDETREYLIEDLAYSQGLTQFAYVEGVGAAPIEAPRGNLTGDPYFTDGYRVVLWVSAEPVALDDVKFIDWKQPHD